jgi:hypothetical protein
MSLHLSCSMSNETGIRIWYRPAIVFALAVSAFADTPSINVCEIAQHAEKYKDKVVTITGTYLHGPHGATVANDDCGFQNRYRPFGFGAAADVQSYDSSEKLPTEAVRFVDERSIKQFDEAIAELTTDSKSTEKSVAVTILALVRVARHYTIRELRDGYVGTGYGFMGRYPVQILILKVKSFQRSAP